MANIVPEGLMDFVIEQARVESVWRRPECCIGHNPVMDWAGHAEVGAFDNIFITVPRTDIPNGGTLHALPIHDPTEH